MKKKPVRTMADRILDSLLEQESSLISIRLNLERLNKILLFQSRLTLRQIKLGNITGQYYDEKIINMWFKDLDIL